MDVNGGSYSRLHLVVPSHFLIFLFPSPSSLALWTNMAVPVTPARPMPGLFMQTPAPSRPAQPLFRTASIPAPSQAQGSDPAPSQLAPSRPSLSTRPSQQQMIQQSASSAPQQAVVPTTNTSTNTTQQLTPIQRASRTINNMLDREARYPDAEQYIPREFAEYQW